MILTDAELEVLTRKTRTFAQIKVLKALGVPYRQRPDGSIVVFRRDVEGPAVEKKRTAREPQIRFSALMR